ncbi:MAG: sulfurtransferase [Burkholderiales bacterium]|nr:sulfurtransferase [Burkholderiales bacterium]
MLRFTRSVLLASAFALGLPAAFAAPLVAPAELAGKLSPAVRLIDIREGKNDAGKTAYELGHLPGSVSVPYSQWRGPKENPGALPEPAKLTQLLQRLGLERDTETVVVYEGKDATDFGAAARVYFTLKAAGLTNLSILNGGVKAWQAAGKPLSTDAAPAIKPSTYVARIDDGMVATRQEVELAVKNKAGVLIDARPAPFFLGETRHAAAKVPGTIEGAKNISHAIWFGKDSSALRPTDEIRRIAQQNGLVPPADGSQTVSFCNTGHWASTNWFVLSEVLGQPNVAMYPDSMVDWSTTGLPMSNVPSRLQQLLIDAKLKIGS